MGKNRMLTAMLLMAVLSVSCEMEEVVRPVERYGKFYVETESPSQSEAETKTFADENGMVLWVNGDLVSVFNRKSYATKYRYDGGTGTTGGVLTEVPESNPSTGTDVSHNPALTVLWCSSNQLTSLDVSHNARLSSLDCISNPQLAEIWLKTGQTIQTIKYDSSIATIKYTD